MNRTLHQGWAGLPNISARHLADRDHGRMDRVPLRRDGVKLFLHRVDGSELLHAVLLAYEVGNGRWRHEDTRSGLPEGLCQGAVVELADNTGGGCAARRTIASAWADVATSAPGNRNGALSRQAGNFPFNVDTTLGDRLRQSFSEPRFGARSPGRTRRRSPRMKPFWAAIDPQQAAAAPKDRISGCSRALPGCLWEKKVRLNFLSSGLAAMLPTKLEPVVRDCRAGAAAFGTYQFEVASCAGRWLLCRRCRPLFGISGL